MVEEDDAVHARQRVGEPAWRPLRISVSSRLTRSTTLPTTGAGTDAASRNRDGEAFDSERRVLLHLSSAGVFDSLAHSTNPPGKA